MSSNHTSPKFIPKEWNVGGAFQFYGSRTPRILILEVDTTDTIVPELLQSAVDRALERLPLLKSTFVRKKGLYYYADNDL